jgi:hypothetical protein
MIIRKTKTEMKKHVKSYHSDFGNDTTKHWIRVIVTTYWLFFIPVYSTEEIISSTL